jgi:hypothetical protein
MRRARPTREADYLLTPGSEVPRCMTTARTWVPRMPGMLLVRLGYTSGLCGRLPAAVVLGRTTKTEGKGRI